MFFLSKHNFLFLYTESYIKPLKLHHSFLSLGACAFITTKGVCQVSTAKEFANSVSGINKLSSHFAKAQSKKSGWLTHFVIGKYQVLLPARKRAISDIFVFCLVPIKLMTVLQCVLFK